MLIVNIFTPKNSHAETTTECSAAASQAIISLLKKDSNNILGRQYLLTTLKAALLGRESVTLETKIKSLSEALRKDEKILPELQKLYETYGKADQFTVFDRALTEANYFNSARRLGNREAAAMLLGYNLLEQREVFSPSDLGITWFMSEIADQAAKSHGKNSSTHNLSQIAVQVARLNGAIADTERVSDENLKLKIADAEMELEKAFEGIAPEFTASLPEGCKDSLKKYETCVQRSPLFTRAFSDALKELTTFVAADPEGQAEISRELQSKGEGEIAFQIYSTFHPVKETEVSVVDDTSELKLISTKSVKLKDKKKPPAVASELKVDQNQIQSQAPGDKLLPASSLRMVADATRVFHMPPQLMAPVSKFDVPGNVRKLLRIGNSYSDRKIPFQCKLAPSTNGHNTAYFHAKLSHHPESFKRNFLGSFSDRQEATYVLEVLGQTYYFEQDSNKRTDAKILECLAQSFQAIGCKKGIIPNKKYQVARVCADDIDSIKSARDARVNAAVDAQENFQEGLERGLKSGSKKGSSPRSMRPMRVR